LIGSNVEYLKRIPHRLSRSKIYLLKVFERGVAPAAGMIAAAPSTRQA
jgi:hypothetical protein